MAQEETFTIDQGSDVAIELHLIDPTGGAKDLNNHTINAKMKKNFNSDSADTQIFNSIIATPATDGIITLSLTNAQTDSLRAGKYVYDVEMSFVDSDSNVVIERVLEGRIVISPSVTR
jgi:hypothetical protein|tara:strand:+ start:3847 stop:4200 length:354 start_codon:yes stop_codon:yes gene_type:complete